MKITMVEVPEDRQHMVHMAVSMVNALVWGGRMAEKVDEIIILKNGTGNPDDAPIFQGLISVYDPETRTCTVHAKGITDQGEDSPNNLAWAICHDLAHAFDVAHGNLVFNREAKTLRYMGKTYEYHTKAKHAPYPEGYFPQFRGSNYYELHNLFEPWETRALFAADSCMAEYRRGEHCPNLLKESA